MPERSKQTSPAAGHLTSIRIALLTGIIVSLGAMFSDGFGLHSLLWCAAQCLILGTIWFLLEAFRREVDTANMEADPVANRLIEESAFLSSMGHDLRQPTQAIAMFAATLSAHPLADSSRKLVTGIETGIHQLSAQMEAVFAIAKVQAGRMPCAPVPVALQDIFEQQLALHLDDAQDAGLHLRYVGTRCKVLADPDVLSRIISSLLAHALHATQEGGVVLGCRQRGARIVIEVWASGKGIPPEQLEVAFTPGSIFGQNYTDRGLGLALAQRLSTLTQGELALRSPHGRGRVLSLSLPRA
jgi:signal transduction histidine kinase